MRKDKESVDRTLKESIINKGYLEVRTGIDDNFCKDLKDKLQRIVIDKSTEVLSQGEYIKAVEIINQGIKYQSQIAMQVTQNPEMEDNDARGLDMIKLIRKHTSTF